KLRAQRDSLTQASGGQGARRSAGPTGNGQSASRIHFGEREGVQGGATQHPPAQRRNRAPKKSPGFQAGRVGASATRSPTRKLTRAIRAAASKSIGWRV